jgi:acyl carrier protein
MITMPTQPTHTCVEQHLADFIRQTALPPGAVLEQNEPLLANGILDSLGILHLVAFIENEYAIIVPDACWGPEHFHSVSHLAKLVARLQAEQGAAPS